MTMECFDPACCPTKRMPAHARYSGAKTSDELKAQKQKLHELDVQAAKANQARRERLENEMRYTKTDAAMQEIEATKPTKPTKPAIALPVMTVKASGLCVIKGRGFETYGFSPTDALNRWVFGVRFKAYAEAVRS